MANIRLKNSEGVEVFYDGVTSVDIPAKDGTGFATFSENSSNPLYQHSLTIKFTSTNFCYSIKKEIINSVATPYTTQDNALNALKTIYGTTWFHVDGYQSSQEVGSSTSAIDKKVFQWRVQDVSTVNDAYFYYYNALKQETGTVPMSGRACTVTDRVSALQ